MIPKIKIHRSYFETRNIEVGLIGISLLLGFFQVWIKRYEVGVDIISYLDLGDALFRGDWSSFLYGLYWPPLYALVLGFFLAVLKPSAFWEYPVIQGVNYLVFTGALAAFHFFLKEFQLFRRYQAVTRNDPKLVDFDDPAVIIVAYALFIWSSVKLIGVSLTNPDMLLAAFLYLASALMLRVARGSGTKLTFALFGIILGFSYLTKAAMFPLSFVFLAVLSCLVGRRRLSRVLIAFVAFCVISGPFVGILTAAKGRPTFSDQSAMLYGMLVNGARFNVHWQGEGPAKGKPVHPTRKLFDNPEAYEFATPIKATYPPYYAPSYWYEGLQVYFDLKQQVKAIIKNSREIGEVFLFGLNGMVVAVIFLSFWMASKRWLALQDILKHWFLLLPAITALGMYSIVHVEPRYIGTFVVIIALILISGSLLYNVALSKGMAILMLAMCLIVTFPESSRVILDVARGKDETRHISWQIVKKLHKLGLREGDRVASVNFSEADIARWARLARVTIVAEVPHLPGFGEGGFWDASSEVRAKIIDMFGKTGAVMIISNEKPKGPDITGWEKLGITGHTNLYATDYYAYMFPAVRQKGLGDKIGN